MGVQTVGFFLNGKMDVTQVVVTIDEMGYMDQEGQVFVFCVYMAFHMSGVRNLQALGDELQQGLCVPDVDVEIGSLRGALGQQCLLSSLL